MGAAYRTAKSGTGIAAMAVMRPEAIMKKGEYIGLFSAVPDILDLCVLSEKWVAI